MPRSMKYAVIKTGGKQYRVSVGDTLQVEKLQVESGEVIFDQVLLMVDEDKIELGTPVLEQIKVYATVASIVKGKKIEVFKYKSKSRYRNHTGHRQKYSQITITSIGSPVQATLPTQTDEKPPAKKSKKPSVKKSAK